jgi:hypothetical protein
MGISRSKLRPSTVSFHGVVSGMEALHIGQIDPPVTFGTLQNFRTETLTIEVVGFSGTYHTILRRPAYAKFMAVPNYTYLKLKIPGPKGIIMVGTTFQRAFECDAECFQFTEAFIRSERLHAEPPSEEQDIPESSKQATRSFNPPRTSRMWPSLTMVVRSVSGRRSILNKKACSSTSSKRTSMCLHGNPPT